MASTLTEFSQSLIDCGLMSESDLQAFFNERGGNWHPNSAEELARVLVSSGKLTKFQAQAIHQGKSKGLVLGNYVVLDKIGQGGMGTVFKARHRRMDRIVALKLLPSSAKRSPVFFNPPAKANLIASPDVHILGVVMASATTTRA